MFRRPPSHERVIHGPQARDLRSAPARAKSRTQADGAPEHLPQRSPEPRLPQKHALNPPIVTIFGAGVAGLTAAHELVERGFIVQVIEANEDPTCPGRPLVGGMAANQPARVRANIEDLHSSLILSARDSSNSTRLLASWLLRCFAFVRSSWIFTERPVRCHPTLYTAETDKNFEGFKTALLEELARAKRAYKARWIWDLLMRGTLLDETYPEEPPADRVAAVAEKCKSLIDCDAPRLALAIWSSLQGKTKSKGAPRELEELPTKKDLEQNASLITEAFDREFLCFKLVPFAVPGVHNAVDKARELYKSWATALIAAHPNSCLSRPDSVPPVEMARSETTQVAWLQLEFVEQHLPGEHGYRFFPGFYRHLDDTMRRIPLFDDDRPNGRTVLDNLRPTVFQGIGFTEDDLKAHEFPPIWDDADVPRQPDDRKKKPNRPAIVVEVPRTRATSFEGFRDRTDRLIKRLGGTQRDAVLLFAKIVRYLTTSPDRRRKEYEELSWRDFVEIEKFSRPIQDQIQSAAQALLAFSVEKADARSYGNTVVQVLLDGLDDGARVDRTLNGPTSDAWLEPWRDYLERQGVRFFCMELKSIDYDKDIKEWVPKLDAPNKNTIAQPGHPLLTHKNDCPGLRPDFYVLALDEPKTAQLLANIPRDARKARDFHQLKEFADAVNETKALTDMTGIQFFFDAKTSIGEGHMYYPHAKWGLSSISQSEFWSKKGSFADGYFGVLSVDICKTGGFSSPEAGSFWHRVKSMGDPPPGAEAGSPGVGHFLAAREVWREIKDRISPKDCLAPPRCVHIDHNITLAGNKTPYLGAVVGLDRHRPGRSSYDGAGPREIEYSINHTRWVLCGTFMATHTRITTMESANESARHAVKAILERLERFDSTGTFTAHTDSADIQIRSLDNKTYNGASDQRAYDDPDIYNPEEEEPEDLDFFRRVDRRLLKLGLPHMFEIIDFDRKLEHALDAVSIYGGEKPLREYLGSVISTLDTVLTKEGGRHYDQNFGRAWDDAKRSTTNLAEQLPGDTFPEMKGLLKRFAKMLDAF